MRVSNVPWLTDHQIEDTAVKVLLHFSETYFSHLRATPVNAIINKLVGNNSLMYDESSHLGFADDGSRIQGCYLPQSRTILLDKSLSTNDSKRRFVAAHELGHFALHRKFVTAEQEYERLEDSEFQLFSEQDTSGYDAQSLDWQANRFAGAILVPKAMLLVSLAKLYHSAGLSWLGKIYIDNQRCNSNDYWGLLRELSKFFGVSKTVIEIRLKSLDLIDDRRGIDKRTRLIKDAIIDVLLDIENANKDEKSPF